MLTEAEGFAAMRAFLDAFWRRGGSRGESDLVDILSWTAPHQDRPDLVTWDPAMWSDWIDAIELGRQPAP